jgi:hypothetical protein
VITQEQLKELLHYCPETGVWTWLVSRGRARNGSEAGHIILKQNGKKYRCIGVLGVLHLAHRLAFLYMNSAFPEAGVDHEDGNGLNNRWQNLKAATSADNAKNQRLREDNVSGTPGVSWHKRDCKWQAIITVNQKQKSIGHFSRKEDAIAARKKAEAELGFHKNHGTDRPL